MNDLARRVARPESANGVVRIASVLAIFSIASIESVRADISIRPSGDHAVRVTIADKEADVALNPALVDQTWPEPTLHLKPGETRSREKVGGLFVSVLAHPQAIRVEAPSGRLIQELQLGDDGSISFTTEDAPILGLGEGSDQFDRRGHNYPIVTSRGRPMNGQIDRLAELGTRIFSPFILGTKGWALFFASPYGGIDLREERGIFTPAPNSPSGVFDIFVIDAKNPADAMQEFIHLTGAPAMPPKWSLGYMQSHRTLSSEDDLLAEARTFREKKLPCDAVIYLGTGFCPAGWNYGHDSFEFNDKVFKRKPAEFIKDMHDLNFHVALHIVPQESPSNRVLYPSMHGHIPAAADETLDKLHVSSYWDRHKDLFTAGIDGWWPDEGDWLDVPSRLARHRMYYQGPLSDKPNVRPWDLQRNGYCGIAQYDGWYWSGDVTSTWKTLANHVMIGQNASLSVGPFWGTDIGGFYPTQSKEYTGELYTRWFQFAAFCPLFRSHGRTWKLHTPIGWNTGETGPVESRPAPDPSELHNADVEPICREYLNLRYQLMPYTYTITRQARDTGMPMMRALALHYPGDPESAKRGDEYLWGQSILVAPVVEHAATTREVYLPPGTWYDWWTNAKQEGGRSISRDVDLRTMPLYVSAGAVIPFDPARQYVDQPVTEPTTIRIYTGADGHFALYDDDGKTLDYERGAGTWTSFVWNEAKRTLEIKLDDRTKTKPPARDFDVLLLPENQHKRISFQNDKQEVTF
jgi:alpha-glucosidase (family GH31 glycosyl hydrolase)